MDECQPTIGMKKKKQNMQTKFIILFFLLIEIDPIECLYIYL